MVMNFLYGSYSGRLYVADTQCIKQIDAQSLVAFGYHLLVFPISCEPFHRPFSLPNVGLFSVLCHARFVFVCVHMCIFVCVFVCSL